MLFDLNELKCTTATCDKFDAGNGRIKAEEIKPKYTVPKKTNKKNKLKKILTK